ncbi:LOW QUALITY PROTEIN: hypothetical protein KUTeg_014185 [Tegillarca granosa]|uniref:Diaminopimelate decarboxylase n=1 Tax=Tegillarca granosa TaxID=220873 RepID=A0ABQ9EZE8_TEGGR|nr:LOW QUALITY PROTEIN: hypothetical protein KUTeg_014185 [Tegillarca granosa]
MFTDTRLAEWNYDWLLNLGFDPSRLMFNGNGKMKWELEMAINASALLNIDSVFNLKQTMNVCEELGKSANVLLRINPSIDVNVHKYFATGKGGSKFGLDKEELEECLQTLCTTDHKVNVIGLHCHLGSTIDDADRTFPFQSQDKPLIEQLEQNLAATKYSVSQITNKNNSGENDSKQLKLDVNEREEIIQAVKDYKQSKISRFTFQNVLKKYPDIVDCVPIDSDITLVLEPGRSLVGNAAVFITTVLGCKKSNDKRYIVIDGAMNDIIRPSFYKAYHHIDFTEPCYKINEKNQKTKQVYDIVLSVNVQTFWDRYVITMIFVVVWCFCFVLNISLIKLYMDRMQCVCFNCNSFEHTVKNMLSRNLKFFHGYLYWHMNDRLLATPFEGCGLAVFDVGAYCSTLASNYNMRLKPGEVMVDGDRWRFIRYPDKYDDLIKNYIDKPDTKN